MDDDINYNRAEGPWTTTPIVGGDGGTIQEYMTSTAAVNKGKISSSVHKSIESSSAPTVILPAAPRQSPIIFRHFPVVPGLPLPPRTTTETTAIPSAANNPRKNSSSLSTSLLRFTVASAASVDPPPSRLSPQRGPDFRSRHPGFSAAAPSVPATDHPPSQSPSVPPTVFRPRLFSFASSSSSPAPVTTSSSGSPPSTTVRHTEGRPRDLPPLGGGLCAVGGPATVRHYGNSNTHKGLLQHQQKTGQPQGRADSEQPATSVSASPSALYPSPAAPSPEPGFGRGSFAKIMPPPPISTPTQARRPRSGSFASASTTPTSTCGGFRVTLFDDPKKRVRISLNPVTGRWDMTATTVTVDSDEGRQENDGSVLDGVGGRRVPLRRSAAVVDLSAATARGGEKRKGGRMKRSFTSSSAPSTSSLSFQRPVQDSILHSIDVNGRAGRGKMKSAPTATATATAAKRSKPRTPYMHFCMARKAEVLTKMRDIEGVRDPHRTDVTRRLATLWRGSNSDARRFYEDASRREGECLSGLESGREAEKENGGGDVRAATITKNATTASPKKKSRGGAR